MCLLPAVPWHLSCRLVSATTVVYISLAAGTKPYIEVQWHVLVKLPLEHLILLLMVDARISSKEYFNEFSSY
jgi:hypothetical protein